MMTRLKYLVLLFATATACGHPVHEQERQALPARGGQTAPVPARRDDRVATAVLATKSPARVFNVGGDVKAPIVLQRVEPKIPAGVPCRGLVMFQCLIDEHGNVVRVEDKSGEPDAFTGAYADAVRRWRFRPATLRGEPVAVHFFITVNIRCA